MDNGAERALRNVNRPLDIIERASNGQRFERSPLERTDTTDQRISQASISLIFPCCNSSHHYLNLNAE